MRRQTGDDPDSLDRILSAVERPTVRGEYLHWDELRHRTPPDGLSVQQWWLGVKIRRMGQARSVPLVDTRGRAFHYALADPLPAALHQIDLRAGGMIGMPAAIESEATRNQYRVRSLTEEAISSSQIEGAHTTRRVAKEMLRQGRAPRDKSEQMILNNYQAMQRIRSLKGEPLSPGLVFELHRIVTQDTLDDPEGAGRLRESDDVNVVDPYGEVLHVPPAARELPGRLEALCRFANQADGDAEDFVHPVIRAMVLHFWLAYDHPFVDGNGRTARALFYWSMLRQPYWIAEYITISSVINKARTAYGRAFLHVETDENDLTYFLIYHAELIRRAVEDLHRHVDDRARRLRTLEAGLRGTADLNHRQRELVGHALRHPGQVYTIESHQNSHAIGYETARADLLDLTERGLLKKRRSGRIYAFQAVPELERRLAEPPRPRRGNRKSR